MEREDIGVDHGIKNDGGTLLQQRWRDSAPLEDRLVPVVRAHRVGDLPFERVVRRLMQKLVFRFTAVLTMELQIPLVFAMQITVQHVSSDQRLHEHLPSQLSDSNRNNLVDTPSRG